MHKTRVAARLSQSLGISTIASIALAFAAVPARAADQVPPPPYIVRGQIHRTLRRISLKLLIWLRLPSLHFV